MPNLKERRGAAIKFLLSNKVRQPSWGAAVASYVVDHPEESEEMATHHYRSFLKKKSDMMASDISTGRHLNRIAVHNFIRNNTKTIESN